MKYVGELYESKKAELLDKDERIAFLESEIVDLGRIASRQIPFADISVEAKTNYQNLSTFGSSHTIITDFNSLDTVPLCEVTWKDPSNRGSFEDDTKKTKRLA